jgi:hypothetical protein
MHMHLPSKSRPQRKVIMYLRTYALISNCRFRHGRTQSSSVGIVG